MDIIAHYLNFYYSIFLSVALLPANPPWRDGRHSHIKLFMTLASALFCLMKDKYGCDNTEEPGKD